MNETVTSFSAPPAVGTPAAPPESPLLARHLVPASLGQRIGSVVIDAVLAGLVGGLVFALNLAQGFDQQPDLVLTLGIYAVLLLSSFAAMVLRGTRLGGLILGLQAVEPRTGADRSLGGLLKYLLIAAVSIPTFGLAWVIVSLITLRRTEMTTWFDRFVKISIIDTKATKQKLASGVKPGFANRLQSMPTPQPPHPQPAPIETIPHQLNQGVVDAAPQPTDADWQQLPAPAEQPVPSMATPVMLTPPPPEPVTPTTPAFQQSVPSPIAVPPPPPRMERRAHNGHDQSLLAPIDPQSFPSASRAEPIVIPKNVTTETKAEQTSPGQGFISATPFTTSNSRLQTNPADAQSPMSPITQTPVTAPIPALVEEPVASAEPEPDLVQASPESRTPVPPIARHPLGIPVELPDPDQPQLDDHHPITVHPDLPAGPSSQPTPATVSGPTLAQQNSDPVDETVFAAVAEVPVAQLRDRAILDSERELSLRQPLVVGRRPVAPAGLEEAQLIVVGDPKMSVSKTHLAIGADLAGWWVIDLHSTNGVRIVGTDGRTRRAVPGTRQLVPDGYHVEFGSHRLEVPHA